ncbi:hypothetical protein SAI_1047 [Streptococcus agalactiae H36B]|nr:hypothetical protein SAI_1047 [Streptococcus agalactiae H36B]
MISPINAKYINITTFLSIIADKNKNVYLNRHFYLRFFLAFFILLAIRFIDCLAAKAPTFPFKPPPNIWLKSISPPKLDKSGMPFCPIIPSKLDISIPSIPGISLGRLLGSIPIFFIILFISPDITPCIICFAWLKSLMNLLTSTKVLPDPAAIRRLRLGLRRSGFSLSSGVIDDTMALLRAISFSSTLKFFIAGLLAIPGSILRRSSIGPIF